MSLFRFKGDSLDRGAGTLFAAEGTRKAQYLRHILRQRMSGFLAVQASGCQPADEGLPSFSFPSRNRAWQPPLRASLLQSLSHAAQAPGLAVHAFA